MATISAPEFGDRRGKEFGLPAALGILGMNDGVPLLEQQGDSQLSQQPGFEDPGQVGLKDGISQLPDVVVGGRGRHQGYAEKIRDDGRSGCRSAHERSQHRDATRLLAQTPGGQDRHHRITLRILDLETKLAPGLLIRGPDSQQGRFIDRRCPEPRTARSRG